MSLSNDEEEAMAIFRSIDHNGDGSLELSELGPALSEFGLTELLQHSHLNRPLLQADIERVLFMLDLNDDGLVDQAEWARGYRELPWAKALDGRPPWLVATGPGQMQVSCERWALSVDKYQELKAKGTVNMYTINTEFNIPWTANSGNSIALLINSETNGLPAQAMISHGAHITIPYSHSKENLRARVSQRVVCVSRCRSLLPAPCLSQPAALLTDATEPAIDLVVAAWGESDLELEDALCRYQAQHEPPLADTVAVWICTLSQYQAKRNDNVADVGPTIQQQLDLDPFTRVISSPELFLGLIAIHTTSCDLYCRLWCPFEMHQALQRDIAVDVAGSEAYVKQLEDNYQLLLVRWDNEPAAAIDAFIAQNILVDTASARCSTDSDKQMITDKVQKEGGFARIDTTIFQKRKQLVFQLTSRSSNVILQSLSKSLSAASDNPPKLPAGKATPLKEGQQFEIHFAMEGDGLEQIATHFENQPRPSRIGMSNTDDHQIRSIACVHEVNCLVYVAFGTDLLIKDNFWHEAAQRRLKWLCPRIVVTCMVHNAKKTAQAAINAGSLVAVWFCVDAISEKGTGFIHSVLLPFLDSALGSSPRLTADLVMPRLQQVFRSSSQPITNFGVELATDKDYLSADALELAMMAANSESTHQVKDALKCEIFADVSVEGGLIYWPSRESSGLIKQNISRDLKLKKLSHQMVACDSEIMNSVKRVLQQVDKRCVFICDPKHSKKQEIESRSRAIAMFVCNYFLTRNYFDTVYRVYDDQVQTEVQKLLESSHRLLLWIDICDKRFLAKCKAFLNKVCPNSRIHLILTCPLAMVEEIDGYVEEVLHSAHFQIYQCEPDLLQREFSEMSIDVKVTGINQLLAVERIKEVMEDSLDSAVEGLFYTDDDQLVVRIQTPDITTLHRIRDLILPSGNATTTQHELSFQSAVAKALGLPVVFDVSHFADGYDRMCLMLDKPTQHQWNVLMKIFQKQHVHLRALAGAGKTYILTYLLLQVLKDKDTNVLLVTNTEALVFHVVKWLWHRTKHYMRAALLPRIHYLCSPFCCGPRRITVDAGTGAMTTEHVPPKLKTGYAYTVIDEAHHCTQTKDQLEFIQSHAGKSKFLACSDLSQADGGSAYLPTGMTELQLTQVVRSTERIVMGSIGFSLGDNKRLVDCASSSAGPPVKTFIFKAAEIGTLAYYETYANYVQQAIQYLQAGYPLLSLSDRLLIIVPDDEFSTKLTAPLQIALGREFILQDATNAAAQLTQIGEFQSTGQRVVLDTVKACDGLERLFCICVGLDTSTTSTSSQVRSWLYRAMTRAQLQTMIVNEALIDGFLAFLGLIQSAEDGVRFSIDEAHAQLDGEAVDRKIASHKPAQQKDAPQAAVSKEMGDEQQQIKETLQAEELPAGSMAEVSQEPAAAAGRNTASTRVTVEMARVKQSIFDTTENEMDVAAAAPTFMPFAMANMDAVSRALPYLIVLPTEYSPRPNFPYDLLAHTVNAVLVCREWRAALRMTAMHLLTPWTQVLESAVRTGDVFQTGCMPTMPKVVQELGMDWQLRDALQLGADGTLEFSGKNGALLAPGLDAGRLLAAHGLTQLTHVTVAISVNSDSHNCGLGPPLPNYYSYSQHSYNQHSLVSSGTRSACVKFHPGMSGGQLRVEGPGGFGNRSVPQWNPKSWSGAAESLHQLEITLGADGNNEVRVVGNSHRMTWKCNLFDGRHLPGVFVWLDDGGEPGKPLHIGDITYRLHND